MALLQVGVLKAISNLGLPLVFLFGVGSVGGLSPDPSSLSALVYGVMSMYLLHASTLPSPSGTAVWLALGVSNIVVLLLKVLIGSPLLEPFQPQLEHIFGVSSGRIWGADVIVFVLVLAQRRFHELGLYSSAQRYDRALRRRFARQADNISFKYWKGRKLALLKLLRSYINRQRRYIERWGLRGGTREEKEKSILERLSKVGVISVQDDIHSVEELQAQVRPDYSSAHIPHALIYYTTHTHTHTPTAF